jgi:YegS/Rv2252/BmrU family lipid kinase
MSVAIIINPRSGRPSAQAVRQRAELAAAVLAEARVPGEVLVTERRRHAVELAAAAVARGARLLVAWGGDGTVNEVATTVVRTRAALAVVPAGSGTGLARLLGVARDPRQALLDAIGARPRAIDCGEIAGRLFVSVAGIGFDAHVAHCFDRDQSGRRGLSTYTRITARELLSYRCGSLTVDGDEQTSVLLVAIANTSQFGNGARIAPGARVDDGLLDLVVVRERSRLGTFWALPRMFVGGLEKVEGVRMTRIEQTRIESDCAMRFHVDGEPVEGGTRLDVRVLPGVLRVALR